MPPKRQAAAITAATPSCRPRPASAGLAASYLLWVLALLACLIFSTPAAADDRPDSLLDRIGFDQHLRRPLPKSLAFRDEAGQPVQLDTLMQARPTILVLSYFKCPQLCAMVLDGLTAALQDVPLTPGKDFDVLAVSIDPKEGPAVANAKKAEYVERYGKLETAGGWHFLTGDQKTIRSLADAVGFRYAYDAQRHEYAHVAGLVLLTPGGTISRYLFGIEFVPWNLRMGLIEAGAGRIGSPVDQVLLRCYQYDPHVGTYTLAVMTIVRAVGITTAVCLGLLVYGLSRRSPKRPKRRTRRT